MASGSSFATAVAALAARHTHGVACVCEDLGTVASGVCKDLELWLRVQGRSAARSRAAAAAGYRPCTARCRQMRSPTSTARTAGSPTKPCEGRAWDMQPRCQHVRPRCFCVWDVPQVSRMARRCCSQCHPVSSQPCVQWPLHRLPVVVGMKCSPGRLRAEDAPNSASLWAT